MFGEFESCDGQEGKRRIVGGVDQKQKEVAMCKYVLMRRMLLLAPESNGVEAGEKKKTDVLLAMPSLPGAGAGAVKLKMGV